MCLISAHDPRHHFGLCFALIAVCNVSLDHYWSTFTFAQSATPRLLLYCRSRGTPIAAKHLHLNHAKLRVAATIPSPSPLLFPQPHSAFREAHTTNTATYMFTRIHTHTTRRRTRWRTALLFCIASVVVTDKNATSHIQTNPDIPGI